MAPSNLDKAEADRKALQDHLEFLDTELARHLTTPLNIDEVNMYLAELEETKKMISPNHNQIYHATPKGSDMEPHVTIYRQLLQLASKVYSGLQGIRRSFPPTAMATSTCTHAASSSKQRIKLPPLELPKFSGNLQEWVPFRDLFETAVHQSSLTKVEKLTQLKSLLTGEAARQIRSLILCEANYDIAWKSLHERYENNRELLFAIMKRLIDQSVITTSNATSIRSLVDTTKECVRSLEVLAIPTIHWDAILLFLLFSKLDATSKELWEQSLPDTSIPTLAKMYEFLEQRARALAASSVQGTSRPPRSQQSAAVRAHHITPGPCSLGCSQTHPFFRCQVFQKQTKPQRVETAKRLKLCHNCLVEGHLSSACPCKTNCKVCNKRHHTMLHLDGFQQPSQQQQIPVASTTPQTHHVAPVGRLTTGILATARIQVTSNHGNNIHRSLVDPGSTNSYITKSAAKRMNLPLQQCNIPMKGLSDSAVGVANYVTHFSFKPYFDSIDVFSATALVVKSINTIPPVKLKNETWKHLHGLKLADPEYFLPNKVDILLGTDVSWTILDNEKISGLQGEPYAVKSSLGWLVAGPNVASNPVTVFNTYADLDYQLRRFWEQEEISDSPQMTQEEQMCENHFATTHKRDLTGRFMVSLPFKHPKQEIGSSRRLAIRRFLSMEKRHHEPSNIKNSEELRKLTLQWETYKEFMQEYEQLGHMEIVYDELYPTTPMYYIPHHSVLKESSTTTKLRVVFDASAATSSGTSLNQTLMVGPQLQDRIWDIMLRFRTHLIAFTADIAKMYRQIRVTPMDTDYQRIVWREHPSLPLRDYRLLTVTYGTAPAPYLAVKCLQQLAKDEEHRFPDAAKVMLTDFYVDDTATGCDTLEQAKSTVQQLIDLCMSGGFELRKWTTNSIELLNSIPETLRETNSLVSFEEDTTIKTLGVYWNPSTDKYLFKLTLPPDMPGKFTKRNILSEIAKIYDPLGWLAPAIISCKIFMQDLWKLKLDWDDILPEPIQNQWRDLRSSLFDLEKIEIPRCIVRSQPTKRTLIGYSDASIKAMSAVLYVFCEYDTGPPTCHVLTSKTKVAPVKHVTLPRLELNAAVLLSELLQSTLKSLHIQFDEVLAFTDSTITLCWIRSNPSRWKMFIRRRVQAIQENVPTAQWFHVPGDKNPADCASRGITANDLLHHHLWWNGTPDFSSFKQSTPDLIADEVNHVEAEIHISSHHVQPEPLHPLFLKFEKFCKLQRVVAYVLRFMNNICSLKRNSPLLKGSLTVHEIITARNFILRQLQQSCYAKEYTSLTSGQELPSNNALLRLQPFISSDGLIRVGGRLRNANLPFARRHPILLPKGHPITRSIIWDIHRQHFHTGPTATLAILQQNYWITNGRDSVREVTRKCKRCAQVRGETMTQIMGDLPEHRVTISPPFHKTGVDYAGPFTIRPMVRSKISLKCWLAIFVCLTTKAIHIEVVSSLSTDCFLAALRRFIARRGNPTDIFSDCGTNFKGADKALRDFFKLSRQQVIQDECANQHISWHFNPPGAPHFGGLWEAGVKSIKHHLTRVMGTAKLTYEEMLTLVNQIEAILNSRPIVPASADPSDLGALTPGHFLIGGPITSFPEPSFIDHKENYLDRWQLIQQLKQLFWKRWSNEYLTRLQQRPKWMKTSRALQVGHLVTIKDERLPPLKWKLGRVIAVHPGPDGHVRVATLKTEDGEIKRPLVKLSLLPISYE